MRGQFAISLAALCLLALSSRVDAGKGTDLKPFLTKPSSVILDDTFSGQKLGQQWVVNKGSWPIQDSVVIGHEKKEDMHAAVLTLQQPHRNSIIRFSFRLDGATGFNLSFNHAKGHLFRVGVSPTGVVITKDKDKKDPNSKAVVLGKANGKFESGQWYTLLLETDGDQVGVQTDNGVKLEAREPSLGVDKTGYRFVTRGSSLQLDDVHVWKVEPK